MDSDSTPPQALLEELYEMRRLFNEAQQIGRCGAFSWDLHTNQIIWSDEFFKLVGRQPHEIEHSWDGFLSCVHEADQAHVTTAAEQVIETGHHPPVQYRVVFPKGEVRYLVSKGRLEYDATGEPVRMVGFAQDVTQQKRYEAEIIAAREAAEQANSTKTQFLAMMSHELRTPLTTILGLTDLLEDHVQSTEGQELLALVRQSAAQLLTVINDLLRLAQVDLDRIEVRPRSVTLRSFLADQVAPLRGQALGKRLSFSLTLSEALPDAVETDPRLLGPVITNLVGNAVKFTEHGQVAVNAAPHPDHGDRFLITVQDTGPGIPEAEQDLVFEPFYQVDRGYSRQHQGRGLGLAIAASFAALLAGTLTLESAEGVGTTLRLTLPQTLEVTAPPVASRVPSLSPTPPVAFTGRVLVVEDHVGAQYLLQSMLKQLGLPFDLASDGEAAVAHYAEHRHAVILMDQRLPGIDGIEAVRRIRAMQHQPPPYIIAQTAYALPHEGEQMHQMKVDDLLPKPFSFSDFRQVMQRAVARQSAA